MRTVAKIIETIHILGKFFVWRFYSRHISSWLNYSGKFIVRRFYSSRNNRTPNNTKPKSPTYPNPFQRPNFETVCPWPKATKSLKVLYRTHGNFIFIISTFLKSHIFEEVKRFNHPLEYRRRHTGNLRWHSHSSCHVLWEKVDVKVANPSCSIYTFFFSI